MEWHEAVSPRRRNCRRHIVVIALLVGFSAVLQFSTAALGSIDGNFHARYAALVWQGGLRGFPPAFPWLPLTIRSAERYFDHHMLFHLVLAPFTTGDLIRGVKLFTALCGAAAFAAVYGVLIRGGVRQAHWWLMAMFALAPDFLYRMQMPRVQALSLMCLLLAVEVSLARRFAYLLPLAVAYTWLYDAFPFLLLIAGLVAAAIAVVERHVEWRAVIYPVVGVTLGLVINPYFPNDVWFIAHHYLGKLAVNEAMHVGSEWYPYPLARWLGWGGAVAVLATAAVLVARARRQLDVRTVALLLIGAAFFVLAWRSRRFIEYAGPFVLLALATALDEWVQGHVRWLSVNTRRALAVIVLLGLGLSTAFAVNQLRRRPMPERYAGGAGWLARHTPAGAIVFTPDWDDFPHLFFHNQHNRYVIGLDPAYLAQQDLALYQLWRALSRGEVTPPSRFLDRFESAVVLSDPTHERFIAALKADRGMEQVYTDRDCVIFRRRG